MSVDKFSQDIPQLAEGPVSQPQGAPQEARGKPSPLFPHTGSKIPLGSDRAAEAADIASVAKEEMADVASGLDREAKPVDSHKVVIDSEGEDSPAMKKALRNVARQSGAREHPEEVPEPEKAGGEVEVAEEPSPKEPGESPGGPAPEAGTEPVEEEEKPEEEEGEEETDFGSQAFVQGGEEAPTLVGLTGKPISTIEAIAKPPRDMHVAGEQKKHEVIVDRGLHEAVANGWLREEEAAILKPQLLGAATTIARMARSENPLELNGYEQQISTFLKQGGVDDNHRKLAVDITRGLKENEGVFGDENWGIAVRPGIVIATPGAVNAQNLKTLPPHIARQVKQAQARNQIITISSQQYRQQLQKGAAQARAFCIAFSAAIREFDKTQTDKKKVKEKGVEVGAGQRHKLPVQAQQMEKSAETGKESHPEEQTGEQSELEVLGKEISKKMTEKKRESDQGEEIREENKKEKKEEIRKEEQKLEEENPNPLRRRPSKPNP